MTRHEHARPDPEDRRNDFAAYTGCVAGASSVADLDQALRDAGFTAIEVVIKDGSRRFIDDWVPGRNAGEFVASANIQASKR